MTDYEKLEEQYEKLEEAFCEMEQVAIKLGISTLLFMFLTVILLAFLL